MKTLEQFTSEAKKNQTTVQSWIRNGLVNGANYDNGSYSISDLARPPYTRASNRNAGTIRKGIVVGCKRRLSVNAKVFKIADYEFEVYVNQVVALGLIERHVVDGVTYFYSTPKAESLSDNQIYKAVKDLTGTVVEAAVGAATEQMLAHA